jgi:hypothetical protein
MTPPAGSVVHDLDRDQLELRDLVRNSRKCNISPQGKRISVEFASETSDASIPASKGDTWVKRQANSISEDHPRSFHADA